MDTHKKLLGILHIVYGSVILVLFLFIHTILNTMLPFLLEEMSGDMDEPGPTVVKMTIDVVRWVFLFIVLIGSAPSIVGGIATLNHKKWGLPVLLVSGCIALFSVPLGTALGIYTIWVFLEDQKIKKPND